MGLLHKLWDDTVAGPAPESGLSKLRRYHSFSSSTSSSLPPLTPRLSPTTAITSHGDDVPISRSITILRTATSRDSSAGSKSIPSSPASSVSSDSPFSPATSRELKRMTRRKSTMEAYDQDEPRNPTMYDWVVISALDS